MVPKGSTAPGVCHIEGGSLHISTTYDDKGTKFDEFTNPFVTKKMN